MSARRQSSGRAGAALALALLATGVASPARAAVDPYAPTDVAASIPPGYHLVEGDIVEPIAPVRGPLSAQATYYAALWPGGVVPYEFDVNVTPANQAQALLAMASWHTIGDGSNVTFVPRTSQGQYIHFQNSTGNSSPVGMQPSGQTINIASWGTVFVIAHEVGHSLGFLHEQSRSDRDLYVAIHPENICQTCCTDGNGNPGPCNFNFAVRGSSAAEWGPYDFDSVMHYPKCAFSTGGTSCGPGQETITVQPGYEAFQDAMGQRDHLSKFDQMVMSFLYESPNWRFVDPPRAYFTFLGTFIFPYPTLAMGLAGTPTGGTLWVTPGTYPGIGTYTTAITIQAPLGGVTLQ